MNHTGNHDFCHVRGFFVVAIGDVVVCYMCWWNRVRWGGGASAVVFDRGIGCMMD